MLSDLSGDTSSPTLSEEIRHLADVSADAALDRAAYAELAEPALVVEESGRIVRVNQEAILFLGYTRLELLGQLIEILVPESLRALHAETHRPRYMVYPQARQMAARRSELAVRTKSGAEIPASISLKPFVVSSGRYVGIVIRLKEETRG